MIRIFSVFFVLSCSIYSCKKDSDEEGYESYRYELWKECGIDSESIVKKVELILKKNQVSQAG